MNHYCVTLVRAALDEDKEPEEILHLHFEGNSAEEAVATAMGAAAEHNLDLSGDVMAEVRVELKPSWVQEYNTVRLELYPGAKPLRLPHVIDLVEGEAAPAQVGAHLH